MPGMLKNFKKVALSIVGPGCHKNITEISVRQGGGHDEDVMPIGTIQHTEREASSLKSESRMVIS